MKRDDLEKSGDLTKMLHYGKSDLVKVKPTFGGEAFELDARLSFKKDGEGNISLVPHFIRKEQKLDEYKEHKFSDNDRKNLRETGNLGRVVDIVDRETGEIIPSYISIDRKTNEITDIPASRVRIPERIGKTEITTQERDMLRAGLPVRDKLIERNDGRKFVTTLQVNVEQRGVEFVPGTGKSPRTAQTQETKGDTSKSQAQGGENAAQTKKEQRRNTWTNEDGSIRPISKWSGVSFTDQQKADYVAGKAVKLENVTDKQGTENGTTYTMVTGADGAPVTVGGELGYNFTDGAGNQTFRSIADIYGIDADTAASGTLAVDTTTGMLNLTYDTTNYTLQFNTSDGTFRFIDSAGTASVSLNMSLLGDNFEDISIDFSHLLNQNHGGSSTAEFEKGAAEKATDGTGKKLGQLTGVSIDGTGKIYGSYDNGNTVLLGQIPVAQFANASGLESLGNNCYGTTLNSGDFDGIGVEVTADGGSMTTGQLEMSNVDLSEQFTDMITTQRGFQANSRIITTSDTLLEELVNLKR